LDTLRFSEMEAKLLSTAPRPSYDYFTRIGRKEGTAHLHMDSRLLESVKDGWLTAAQLCSAC
jgi:hypothetical protein